MALFRFFKVNKTLKTIEQLCSARKFADAETLLQSLLEKSPNDAHLLLHATVLAYEKGEVEKSRQLAESALKLQPDNPVLHLAMGEIHFRLKNIDGAVDHLNK